MGFIDRRRRKFKQPSKHCNKELRYTSLLFYICSQSAQRWVCRGWLKNTQTRTQAVWTPRHNISKFHMSRIKIADCYSWLWSGGWKLYRLQNRLVGHKFEPCGQAEPTHPGANRQVVIGRNPQMNTNEKNPIRFFKEKHTKIKKKNIQDYSKKHIFLKGICLKNSMLRNKPIRDLR